MFFSQTVVWKLGLIEVKGSHIEPGRLELSNDSKINLKGYSYPVDRFIPSDIQDL